MSGIVERALTKGIPAAIVNFLVEHQHLTTDIPIYILVAG
jgi:hypothetical protein